MRRIASGAAFAIMVCALSGCATIENGLQSLSGSSDSGSRSLGSGEGVHASASYQRNGESLAVAWLDRENVLGDLLRGVSRIGELGGISDWQTVPATLTGLRAVVFENRHDDQRIARVKSELEPLGPDAVASTCESAAEDGGEDREAH